MWPQKNRFLSGVTAAGPLKYEGEGKCMTWTSIAILYFVPHPKGGAPRGPTKQSMLGAPKPECARAPQSRVCRGPPNQIL